MAKDLFAPPTEDELKLGEPIIEAAPEISEPVEMEEEAIEEKNLFAPPTEQEIAKTEPIKKPEISPIEAVGLGIAEGATLGADRPIGGLAAVAGEAIGERIEQAPYDLTSPYVTEPISPKEIETPTTAAKRTFERTKQNIIKRRQQMLDEAIATGDDNKVADLTEKIAQTKQLSTNDIVDEYEPLKTYIEGKKTISDKQKQAWEEHPLYHLGGSFVGSSALLGIGTKAAQALAKAGKLGKVAAKAVPTTAGIEKATRIGKRAKGIKHLKELSDRYNQLQKIKRVKLASEALKEGAKAGAITGFMTSEGELSQGEVGKIVKDAATGGLIGGATGYGLTKTGQLGSDLIQRIPILNEAIESFALGLKGRTLNVDTAKKEVSKAARKWVNSFGERLNKLGLAKKKLYKLADKFNTNVDVTENLAQLREELNKFSPVERKKYGEFIDLVESYYTNQSPELIKLRTSLEKNIAQKAAKKPLEEVASKLERESLRRAVERGKVPTSVAEGIIGPEDIKLPGVRPEAQVRVRAEEIAGRPQIKAKDITPFDPTAITESIDPTTGRKVVSYTDRATGQVVSKVGDKPVKVDARKMSLEDAERLIDTLNLYTGQTAEKPLPKGVRGVVRKTAGDIRKNINKELSKRFDTKPETLNKKLSTLIEGTEEYIGLPQRGKGSIKKFKDEAEVVMSEFLAGTKDEKILTKKSQLIQRINDDVDPKLAKEFSDTLDDLKRLYDLSRLSELSPTETAAQRSLWGKAVSQVNQIANTLGRITAAPKAKIGELATISKNIMKMKSPEINNLINRMLELGKPKYNELFYRPLQKAINSSEKAKNAILFGLMQRPEFKEMIDEVQKPTEKEKE
jgi:hypothetical protein